MTPEQAQLEAEEIAGCDADPIHTPGYIQPFGFLLGLDEEANRVLYTSTNTSDFLGVDPEKVLEADAKDLLGSELVHAIRNMKGRSTAEFQRELVGDLETEHGTLKVASHVRNGISLLEVCTQGNIPVSQAEGLDRLRWLTRKVNQGDSTSQIVEEAVKNLRAFSGYDRVMAYRFRPDGSGEVIAEARANDIEGYLGLRFPEFDIPAQARVLYATTPIRMIRDVDSPAIGLISHPGQADLDMSLAILRGTMPVHCDYLRNMGIRATLSLPVVVDGKLWGLFAFHHRAPRHLGGGVSLAIEFAGQYLNMVIGASLKALEDACQLEATKLATKLFATNNTQKSTEISWSLVKRDLLNLIPADGVAHLDQSGWKTFGACPPSGSLQAIDAASTPAADAIWTADALVEKVQGQALNGIAGALKIQIEADPQDALYFFRNEASVSVLWAGSPEKVLDTSGPQPRLSPRGSFSAFSTEMSGRSDGWEPQDIITARGLLRALDYARQEKSSRDSMLETMEILVQELNHRVRNILALVQSIIRQSKPSDDHNTKAYLDVLEARILALASAHNVLIQTNARSLDLQETLKREAAPYSLDRLSMSGPSVGISADLASMFVLVIHELFSNAAKYGAYSNEAGRLEVVWRMIGNDLQISWTEMGGPTVTEPKALGFGQTLVQNAFAYEFGGSAQVAFLRDGVKVELTVPGEVLVIGDDPVKPRRPVTEPPTDELDKTLLPGNVLIVEDDFLIANQMKGHAETLGAGHVFLASNNSHAISLISENTIDFAMLDINLAGNKSAQTASILVEKEIPFLFATGYGSGVEFLTGFPQIPVVTKPVTLARLKVAVSTMKSNK